MTEVFRPNHCPLYFWNKFIVISINKMKTVTKILVPVDFSETSKTAMRLAFEWSNLLKCEVILLATYRLIQNGATEVEQSPREIRKAIKEQKSVQFDMLKKELDFDVAHQVSIVIELGFMPNCIQQIVQEQDIDLIIYGVKPKAIPNTNADLIRALKDDHTPFLIVHGNHQNVHFQSIDELENDIKNKELGDFIQNFETYLSDLDRFPHTSFMIHPSGTKNHSFDRHSSIVERITNFNKN